MLCVYKHGWFYLENAKIDEVASLAIKGILDLGGAQQSEALDVHSIQELHHHLWLKGNDPMTTLTHHTKNLGIKLIHDILYSINVGDQNSNFLSILIMQFFFFFISNSTK